MKTDIEKKTRTIRNIRDNDWKILTFISHTLDVSKGDLIHNMIEYTFKDNMNDILNFIEKQKNDRYKFIISELKNLKKEV